VKKLTNPITNLNSNPLLMSSASFFHVYVIEPKGRTSEGNRLEG